MALYLRKFNASYTIWFRPIILKIRKNALYEEQKSEAKFLCSGNFTYCNSRQNIKKTLSQRKVAYKKRAIGFEPTTSTLARSRSAN